MATLHLTDRDAPAPALRDWLGGRWGLLFSHPGDFEYCGLERDRWLAIVGEALQGSGVQPLACGRPGGGPDASWIDSVTADRRSVRLEGTIADLAARALRAEITMLQSQGRFVLAIDGSLRRQGLLRYPPARGERSPLQLLSSLSGLRQHRDARRAA